MAIAKCPRLYGEVSIYPGLPSIQAYREVVLDEWALYDESRHLIPDSGFYRGVSTYAILGGAPITNYVAARLQNRLPPGDYFWLGPFHLHFGHFLVSTLARAWAFRDHVRADTKIVYIGGGAPRELFKIGFVRDCLTALGIRPEQMLQVVGPACFPQITIPAMSFIENHSIFASHIAMLREIAKLESHSEFDEVETPVYVSKENVSSGVRSIVNENELTSSLRQLGFEIASPENLPFQQQLAFWRRHRNVVGFASSAFHISALFQDKQLCTISHDAYASTNQVLLDAASGNQNIHLCVIEGLVSRGPNQQFSDTVEIKNPVELAANIAQVAKSFYQERSVAPQRIAPEPRTLFQSAFVDEPFGYNIAQGGKATQSSVYELNEGHNRTADGPLSGRLTGCYQCSTALEDQPWWQVELAELSTLFEVRVYNRCDNPVAQARLSNVAIQLSIDGATWTTVAKRTEPEMVGGLYGVPYRWLAPPGTAARCVRLMLPGTAHFHIDQIEIFGERAQLPLAMRMPGERLSMRKIREVLRLRFAQGLSQRAVGSSLGLSTGAVNSYLSRALRAGLSWPLPETLDDAGLEALLYPAPPDIAPDRRPMPDWAVVHREMRRPNVTLSLLWEEYRCCQSSLNPGFAVFHTGCAVNPGLGPDRSPFAAFFTHS